MKTIAIVLLVSLNLSVQDTLTLKLSGIIKADSNWTTSWLYAAPKPQVCVVQSFDPVYPKDFKGDYFDLIRTMFFKYFQGSSSDYDCWSASMLYHHRDCIEVRVFDPCGIPHNYTFKQFKELLWPD